MTVASFFDRLGTVRAARQALQATRAFSSEVDTGSREENASKQESRAPIRFDRIGKGSSSRQARRLRGMARRMGRGKSGVAAVEFALILPMMLVLYFGCAVLAQGLEAGRKAQNLASTLSNITARTSAGTYVDGNCAGVTTAPCVTDTDLNNIFNIATSVLYPFNGATKMTISEIIFDNKVGTTTCCDAKLVWSAPSAGASPRSCQTFASTGSGPTTIPAGQYPATSDSYLIVADVTYVYAPSFGFTPFNWGPATNGYTITVTTYMTPRGSATQAIQWTPSGTIANPITCQPTSNPNPPSGYYNVP